MLFIAWYVAELFLYIFLTNASCFLTMTYHAKLESVILARKSFEKVRRWVAFVQLIMTTHEYSNFKLKEQAIMFPKPIIHNDNLMTTKKEQVTCLGTQVEDSALWG